MWNLILHFYPWIKSIDKSGGWQTWPEPMESLKDKKILSKDRKILSMYKSFLSFNFIHQCHVYLQCDMQNWRMTLKDKNFLSMDGKVILQFCISHCKYRWYWWIKLKDKKLLSMDKIFLSLDKIFLSFKNSMDGIFFCHVKSYPSFLSMDKKYR